MSAGTDSGEPLTLAQVYEEFFGVKVTNTFLSLPIEDASGAKLRRCASAPDLTGVQPTLETRDKLMAHRHGSCKPCKYFAFMPDGCRNGNACRFCHVCDQKQAKSVWRRNGRKGRKTVRRVPDHLRP
ncbi:unnamed protein product [Effrenium voratum]|nr:unnamed protein product [Effrenium voratum]